MFLSRSGSIFLLLRLVTAAATGVGILAKAMGSHPLLLGVLSMKS